VPKLMRRSEVPRPGGTAFGEVVRVEGETDDVREDGGDGGSCSERERRRRRGGNGQNGGSLLTSLNRWHLRAIP
jgi:hypothetical protein